MSLCLCSAMKPGEERKVESKLCTQHKLETNKDDCYKEYVNAFHGAVMGAGTGMSIQEIKFKDTVTGYHSVN